MVPLLLCAALVLLQGRASSLVTANFTLEPTNSIPWSRQTHKGVGEGCSNVTYDLAISPSLDTAIPPSPYDVASPEGLNEWRGTSDLARSKHEGQGEGRKEEQDLEGRNVNLSTPWQQLFLHQTPHTPMNQQEIHKSQYYHHHHNHHHNYSHQRSRRHLRKRHQRPAENHSLVRHYQESPRLQFTQQEYRVTLKEDVPIHTSLLTVGVNGVEGLLKYHLSDAVNFGINNEGVIYTLRQLDHEGSGGLYTLQVTAENQEGGDGGVLASAAALVSIVVTDAPESPHFEAEQYQFTISEFAREGSYVGTVKAKDEDGDIERYFLHGTEGGKEEFSIDTDTGVISLESPPDGTRWQYHLQVGVKDRQNNIDLVPVSVFVVTSGNPSYAMLVSGVQGDTGRRPSFRDCESYEDTHVMENVTAGTPVLAVIATDEDSGTRGLVSYSIIHSFRSFAIQTLNQRGYITTTRRLDRDGGDEEFMLTVVAKDGGSPPSQASCSFRVIVDDLNDNPPVFNQARYEQTLSTDHSLALPVLRVSASDRDAGKNAQLTYHLEGHPNHLEFFYLEPITGVLTLKRSLQNTMNTNKIFNVRVRAVDGGTPPLWSTAPITVRVVSSGELPPTVSSQQPLQPAILENTTENTDVVVVCARSNLPDAPNVYFTLLNGDTPETNSDGTFALREMSDHKAGFCGHDFGVSIYVATRNLDYEELQAYKLNLLMVNEKNGRLEHQIVVDIVDVNDNAPLLQAWDGAVLENAVSTLITTIRAVDKDVSPQYRQLRYSFDATAPHDVVSRFALRSNGELWSTRRLDREEKSQYRVPIRVTDGMPGHARVTIYWITVQDVNDIPPVFDRSLGVYEVQLPEDREVGKPTGIRLAVDDPDLANQFTFDIISGNEKGKFRVDAISRTLVVAAPLDYDDPVNDRNFTMRVRVSDGANVPAVTDVVVAVMNVNDLQPVFLRANYTFVVTENVDCSIPLGQVTAVDPDLPPSVNQDIVYYLSRDEQTNFTIDSRIGQLSIKGCLDREATSKGTVTLYPLASDERGEGQTADPATVVITVRDLNDNYPHLVRPPQSYAKVMENVEPHLVEPVVMELGDLDTEEHGCPCSIEFDPSTSPAIRDKFTLTPLGRSRYRLSPTVLLDREEQKVYRMSFTARDREGVGGTLSLTVEVGDENDSQMTDGTATIRVYDYQGQFPAMVIGSVHVSDNDDHDTRDKTFLLEPSNDLETAAHFTVDQYTGDITMLRGTPTGIHTLNVKVHDSFRGEEAIGVTRISVVELTQEALTHSGSIRLANTSSKTMLQETKLGDTTSTLYEQLREQIASIHQISEDKVDIFLLRDAPANLGVDVRYSCRGSLLCSSTRLNGVMLEKRQQVSAALGVDISLVDLNKCLYEANSPCGGQSCQHTLRPNLTAPLVVSGVSASLVGLDVIDDYACSCGALEPPPSVCYSGFCFNGGFCIVRNNSLTCQCLDITNYGPRCELLTARFESTFAWYSPLTVCEHSSLSFLFQSHESSGILLYSGPTVSSPWPNYPRDFMYIILRNWVVEIFIDLGVETINISIPVEANSLKAFHFVLTWGERGVAAEVVNCGINATRHISHEPCRKNVPLPLSTISSKSTPGHLLNVQGPLQVGGVASTVSFLQLADSYSWNLVPPNSSPFSGCIMNLRHNDHLYDLNATDFSGSAIQPCDAPRSSRVVLGRHSIIIILASLLSLFLLLVVILCLARRGRKSLSYPDMERELVKETMGGTDLEGFGEKDVTHFDLKFLQVTPDGYLVGDENERPLPDVAQDACLRDTSTSLTQMPESLTIRDFIKENIVKVNQQHQELEDVRHYCMEGDEMSAASLSSLTSGSSRSDMTFISRTEWCQKFEKLVQIYGVDNEGDGESEDESLDTLRRNKSRNSSFLVQDSTNEIIKDEASYSPPPPPAPSSPICSTASDSKIKINPEPPHVCVLVTNTPNDSLTCFSQTKFNGHVNTSSQPVERNVASLESSSLKRSYHRVDALSVSKNQVDQTLSTSLHNQQLNLQTPIITKHKSDGPLTTINNLYTNPAHRSAASTKPSDVPSEKSLEAPKETIVNGHLISNPNLRQCSKNRGPQLSSSSTNMCDNQKTPATSGKSVKGVETWC